MPPRSLHVLSGAGASATVPVDSFRLRPGERPTWLDVDATDTETRRWCDQAAGAGLSVDVWIALKLEWTVVHADVPARSRVEALVNEARREADAPRLAPSDELRRWLRFLSRGPQPHAEHDLPSVTLPVRIVARIAPATVASMLVATANDALDPDALIIERAASLNGMTMESWAYRALARLA
jgi:hypothetical protein